MIAEIMLPSLSCRFLLGRGRRLLSTAAPVASSLPARVPVTLIQGDGVYPEIMDCVQSVLQAAGAPLEFRSFSLSDIHGSSSSEHFQEVVASVEDNGVCLRGIMGVPELSRTGGLDSIDMRFRRALDLFANVVTVKSHPGIPTRHHNIDMVVIREQIEGEYSALEHESVPGVIECLKIVTEQRSRRIAKFAFDYATKFGRHKVTAVHKANIMKLGDGLFLKSCQEMAELYPNIAFETMIVDNCTMQLVSNPHQFDVTVMPNLYGDILINLASGLVGGAGVTSGKSYSASIVSFEPACKHTYAVAAGKNVANPTAMLKSASEMLLHLNLRHHSKLLNDALEKVIRVGKVKTKDMGGHSTTRQFASAVIDSLRV